MYNTCKQKHLNKDEIVPWETLKETERLMNREATVITAMYKIRGRNGQSER